MAEDDKNPNAILFGLQVGHIIGLQRLATGTVRRVVGTLNRLGPALRAVLDRNAWDDVARVSAQEARVDKILEGVGEATAATYKPAMTALQAEAADLARYEADYQAAALTRASGAPAATPTAAELRAGTLARPFQGRVLREWAADVEAATLKRIRDTIRQGYLDGQSVAEVAARIRGTAALGYADGLLQVSLRDAESLVRTAMAHTATRAAEATYRANADRIRHLRWCSVLDKRTTAVCRSRSGLVFQIDHGPRPPAHWNCRSTMVPELVDAPPFEGQTYAEWLRTQPAADQDDILGVAKGKLFRSGGLTLDRFVDRNGRELTLDQMRARDAAAFTRSGL